MTSKMDRPPHPMVAVPDAIRTVLREAASIRLRHNISPIKGSPSSPWKDLLNQTLARDVVMQEPGYPGYNASIMDGYVIRSQENFDSSKQWTHHIVDKVYAGDTAVEEQRSEGHELPTALYITTGAPIPKGYDCVVPVEQCMVSDDAKLINVSAEATIAEGKWIRGIGCDMEAGSVVLPRGHVLDPVALGLLLQSGAKEIFLQPQIKVGVLSTGNELIRPNQEEVKVGQIPDVNRPILLSLLSTFGTAVPIDLGIERDDDIGSLTETIGKALDSCDVIITTGGISMGETDVVEEVLIDRLGGTLHFGRMHMKPGKPTTFVTISGKTNFQTKLVFAMPGNPVSGTVCTQLLVRPCLDLLYNGPDESSDTHGESFEEMVDRAVQNAWVHPEIRAALSQEIKLDKERPEYRRVTLVRDGHGGFKATATGVQRSSRLQSLRDAEGLLVLPQAIEDDKTVARKGEEFTVLLFNNDRSSRVQLSESSHLQKNQKKELRIGLIRVIPKGAKVDPSSDLRVGEAVSEALSGTKSGKCRVVDVALFDGKIEDLFSVVLSQRNVDLHVISCAPFAGSFPYYLEVASLIRQQLVKLADSMALQARQGAAAQDPVSALFEVVVGYVRENEGAMLICLPEEGLTGGLQNVRGLLKHALKVARAKPGQSHH